MSVREICDQSRPCTLFFLSHGQSICGRLHVSSTCEKREKEKISRKKSPCTVRVTGSRSGTTRRESRESVVARPRNLARFPQISSQVSNLPFAGSRHQTNPAMYRFMRGARNLSIPVAGIPPFACVGFGGASVRGSPHSTQLTSTCYRKSCVASPLAPLPLGRQDRASRPRVYPPQLLHSTRIQMAPLPDRNSTNQGPQEGVYYRLVSLIATKLPLPWLLGWPAVGPMSTPHPCLVSCSSRPENELDRPRWGPPTQYLDPCPPSFWARPGTCLILW